MGDDGTDGSIRISNNIDGLTDTNYAKPADDLDGNIPGGGGLKTEKSA
ncbi:hypothetical protein EUX98_g4913 [Antrodiella citrinella]|uniref:Uncharacterized protein n=1 Tax=Antrodiella citrinella TaxID=2447956 RepID=A0A4S4MT14_9APHY|nr:hypothetical protein EUX98_g4913 [Antrodiella citrinella]